MFEWERLKKLSGSRFSQYTILVPIIGWLLIYQNIFLNALSEIFDLEIVATPGWELLLFYLGLVLVGVAAGLFRVFGPEAVLSHDGVQEYARDTEEVLTRREFALLCKKMRCETPKEIRTPLAGTGQVLEDTLDQWKRLNADSIRDALWKNYREENQKNPALRIVIGGVFALGAMLTFFPTLKTVIWVFGNLLNYTAS